MGHLSTRTLSATSPRSRDATAAPLSPMGLWLGLDWVWLDAVSDLGSATSYIQGLASGGLIWDGSGWDSWALPRSLLPRQATSGTSSW